MQVERNVAAVAPVHNRREKTLRWLKDLYCAERIGLNLSAIVVDDGSTDGTAVAVRARFPEVDIVTGDGTLWYTAGTNRGVERALTRDPDYVLTMNDDSRMDRSFLVRLIACAEANPRSIVGPLLLLETEPDRLFQVAPEWRVRWGGWRHHTDQTLASIPAEAWDVELIVGNCVLFPAEALRECGLMDEFHLPHYGDAELTARMRKAGWRLLIEPGAKVFCDPTRSWPALRSLPPREIWHHLWADRRSGHNLRSRIFTNWRVAPSRLAGVAASVVSIAGLCMRAAGFRGLWPPTGSLGPLRERPALLHARVTPSSPPKTISFVWPYVEWGGVQIYFLNVIRQAKGRFHVRAIIPEGSDPGLVSYLEAEGVSVETFPDRWDLSQGGTSARKLLRRWRKVRCDARLLRRLLGKDLAMTILQVDIDPSMAGFFYFVLLFSRRVVYTVHTAMRPMEGARDWLAAWRFSLAARRRGLRILAANVDAKKSLERRLAPREYARVGVSYGCVDSTEIRSVEALPLDRAAERRRLGLSAEGLISVTVGQFIPRKGCWDLLEAASEAERAGLHLSFAWLANYTPGEADLRRVAGFGLGSRFRILTPREFGPARRDVLMALRLGDLFALPSLEEGLPLALLEAMALGLPCVSTTVNGIPEALVDGRTGLLVPPSRPDELFRAFARLTSDSTLRMRLGAAARARAQGRFDVRQATLATLRAYDGLP